MENYTLITEAIGSLGFPIVVAGILLYLLWKEHNKDSDQVNKMIEALNNNTAVMSEVKAMVLDLKEIVTSLVRRLDKLESRSDDTNEE